MVTSLALITALSIAACPGNSGDDSSVDRLPAVLADVPLVPKTLYKDTYEKARKEITRDNAAGHLQKIERDIQRELRELNRQAE